MGAVALAAVAAGALPPLTGIAAAASSGTYSVSGTPLSTVAGQTQSYTVTYTAQSGDVMSQVTLSAPGFTIRTASTPTLGWSTFFTGTSGVMASGASIPGQQVELDITATAPTKAGTVAWKTSGTGLVGSETSATLTNTGTDPVLTVSAGPTAALTFTAQPSDTPEGEVMTPAVQVREADQYGNPTSGSITLTTASVPAGATDLPQTVATVNGVAAFPNIQIDQPGTGYTLAASSGPITGTSAAFSIIGTAASPAAVSCPANESPCTSPLVGSAANTQVQLADSPASGGTTSDSVVITDDPTTAAPAACSTSAVTSVENAASLASSDSTRSLLATFDVPAAIVTTLGGTTSPWVVCYQSPTSFQDVNGNTVNQGVLPACPATSPAAAAPCVASVDTSTGAADITLYSLTGQANWVALPASQVP